MKYNFRQIFAVATSALLVGMTAGVAGAANYPAPFVSSGVGDFAVVHGASPPAAATDLSEATSVANQLLGLVTGGAVGFGDDMASLGTGSSKIWLNTSLNTATSTLTKSDLSSVLADYTFSGNVDSKMTAVLKVGAGITAGNANSNKVIFARQPTSSEDPVIGISMGSNRSQPLYNATLTFSAVNFSHSDSEGETVQMFGREFVVSTETDFTDLVLFKSAQKVSLVAGGSSPTPSTTVTIDGTAYTVELVTGSGTTSATVSVNGDQRTINAGSSKKIAGLEVAVKDVTESTALSTITTTLLLGSERITLRDGSKVLVGSDETPIDGTEVQLVGHGTGATTEVTVSVFAPRTNDDVVLAGESFVDPVFGSFQLQFTDLSIPADSTDRETISVRNSGDDSMTLTFEDSKGSSSTLEFAHNVSNKVWLADLVNKTIHVREKINVSEEEYVVLGNEDYGFIAQVTQIYNDTSTDYTKDRVTLQDALSGETYDTVFTAESVGTLTVHGKQHSLRFHGDGESGNVAFDSVDASATQMVVYPTIKTANGAMLAFYEPLQINLADITINPEEAATVKNNLTAIRFPDGDGYTNVVTAFGGVVANNGNWTIGGTSIALGETSGATGFVNFTTVTIGQLTYNFTGAEWVNGSMGIAPLVNATRLYLTAPVTASNAAATNILSPAIVLFEPKDDNSNYEVSIIQLETTAAGDSDSGLGVNSVVFTSPTHWSATLRSNTDITKHMDWFGVGATVDAGDSDQQTADLSVPKEQVYANINVGNLGSTTSTPQLGSVVVTANEVTSVQSKNLVVVGGSCVNSVAATLVGGANCGSAWTTATGVGTGQFVIQSYANPYASGKVALLVAGYEREDTVNAATYLRNKPQGDIDTTVGKKYVGSTATQATLQVSS